MTLQMQHQIKCGNIAHGVYLLDDIKTRLNERLLDSSICRIIDITSDDHTWIKLQLEFIRNDFSSLMINDQLSYITGMVTGILIWSGVEVI